MIKKILALILAAAICLTTVVFAAGGDYEPYTIPNEWAQGFKNAANIDKTANFFQVTKAEAYSGENSLEVLYPLGDIGNGTAMYLRNYSVEGLPAGEYDIKLCIKDTKKGTPIKLHLEQSGADFTKELKYYYAPNAGIRVSSLENGWFEYSITANAANAITQFYLEVFDRIEPSVYIDNIRIMHKGEDENLLTNGDFESVTVESKVLKYEPVNVMVSERDQSILTPSWRNPSVDAQQIRLYNITDGKDVLLYSSFNTSAGAYNHFQITGLEAEKEYVFRIEFDFGESGVREFYISGVTNNKNVYNCGGWSSDFKNGADYKYTPVWAGLDSETKHGGNTALNIKSNLNGENSLFLELNIAFNNIFEKDKDYRISVWTKAEEMQANAVRIMMEGSYIGNFNKSQNYDWTNFTFDYNTAQNATSGCLKFWVMQSVRNFWIDDIAVYETENGSIVGDNLIADESVAGFEKGFDGTEPPSVMEAAAEAGSRQAKLSWTNPPSAVCDKVKIYQIIEDETVLRGVLPITQSEITLSHLENEKEYTYIIKTVSKYGIESAGREVSVTPITPETEITPVVTNGGTDILGLGTNTFEIKAANNFSAEDLKVELIASMFKNGGKELVWLKTDSASLAAGEEAVLQTDIDIPNDENDYTIRIYVWDSLFGLNSLQKTAEFEF